MIVVMMIRLFLSIILWRAVLHKIRDYKNFQSELEAYQLLPRFLLPTAILTLIIMEILTALTLLNIEWRLPALIAAVLFFVYAIAMVINLAKGRASIGCGCGGVLAAQKTISWSLVIRNLVLTLLALLCTKTVIAESLSSLEIFIILAGAMVSLLIYETTEQAIANSQNYRRWQTQRMLKH